MPPKDITASWALRELSGAGTVWSNWIITPTVIGHTKYAFDAEMFDQFEELNGVKAEVTRTAAWVRPLSSIIEFSVASTGAPQGEGQDWWYEVSGATVRFADGGEVALPDSPPAYADAEWRQRWDDFIGAIRSSIR